MLKQDTRWGSGRLAEKEGTLQDVLREPHTCLYLLCGMLSSKLFGMAGSRTKSIHAKMGKLSPRASVPWSGLLSSHSLRQTLSVYVHV